MSDLKESLRKIADDLTNLEINTIVRSDIIGTKMPIPRHALIDVATWYQDCLADLLKKPPLGLDIRSGKEFKLSDTAPACRVVDYVDFRQGPDDKGGEMTVRPGSYQYFDILRDLARFGIDVLSAMEEACPDRAADMAMLYRIKDTSDQIKGVFNALRSRGESKAGPAQKGVRVDPKDVESMRVAANAVAESRKAQVEKVKRVTPPPGGGGDQVGTASDLKVGRWWDNNYTRTEIENNQPPFPLTSNELVTIRKAWEIGTEKIAMQTVIQLDGDVVTRISPEYAKPDKKVIHEIHQQGVSISMKAWGELVGVVKEFFEKIVGLFAPKITP